MVGKSAAKADKTIGETVGPAVVSIVRFSSIVTLYGLEQLQYVPLWSDVAVSKTLDRVGATVESLAGSLAGEIAPSKMGVLETFSNAAKNLVHISFEGLNLLSPSRILRASDELVQKSAEVVSKWGSGPKPEGAHKPELAVKVLGA